MKVTLSNRPVLLFLLLIMIVNVIVIVGTTRAVGFLDRYSQVITTPEESAESLEITKISQYYSVGRQVLPDGKVLEVNIIGGPPQPPPGFEAERTDSIAARTDGILLPNLPSYSWVFGCSAVSGAIIAGYYDSMGYPNMYTGPSNAGVMPITDTVWPLWVDGVGARYPNNPLVASHLNLDGHMTRGSIDDYWVSYDSATQDPFIINGWMEHAWGSAIGDYMKTSQSNFGNTDGSSTFWNYGDASKLLCDAMPDNVRFNDGTYGRKLFYEARGYSVGECYNQITDNKAAGGFSLADYQNEINVGHPVLLNLEGHSVVGLGYNGTTIYIKNAWDSDPFNLYMMPWGGSYDGMELLSVSIVRLSSNAPPGAFVKANPPDKSTGISLSPTLSWSISFDPNYYEYCYDTIDDGICSSTWVNNGTNTSVELSGLSPGTTYYWHLRSDNDIGTTHADGLDTAFWQFETGAASGVFEKITPPNGDLAVSLSPTLSWPATSGVDYYEYCLDTTDDDVCNNGWINNGASTSVDLSGLANGTRYYWQVRSVNKDEKIYSNGGENEFWFFSTAYRVNLPMFLKD